MSAGRWEDEILDAELGAGVSRGANRVAHILLLAVAGFFITALLWAHNATLDEITRGEGKIVPSGQTKIVQHFEGGIVTEILVEEGQVVEDGTPLMRIENRQADAELAEKTKQYRNLLAKAARLEAEVAGASQINFPEEVVRLAPSVAVNEQNLFERRQTQLSQQVQILREQRNQKIQELRELEAKVGQTQSSLKLKRQEKEIMEPLLAQGAISQVELLRAEQEVLTLETELEGIELAIPRTRIAVSEANQRIEEKTSTFIAEAQQELNETRVAAAGIEEEIVALRDREQRTEVRSPVSGSVNKMLINTIGGVVKPGDPILEIVPLGDKLIVEAKIRPSDRAQLYQGLPATVKVSAYDFSVYGGLEAVLLDISADTIVDEEGESYYRIRLRTDKNNLRNPKKPDEELPIIPGMTATVDILTGEKTVLQYLLKPIIKAKQNALTER